MLPKLVISFHFFFSEEMSNIPTVGFVGGKKRQGSFTSSAKKTMHITNSQFYLPLPTYLSLLCLPFLLLADHRTYLTFLCTAHICILHEPLLPFYFFNLVSFPTFITKHPNSLINPVLVFLPPPCFFFPPFFTLSFRIYLARETKRANNIISIG